MDMKYYKFTRVETLDIDVDDYVEDIESLVEDRLCEDYDIYEDENRTRLNSVMSDLMKDIIEKLVKKYVDKT